MERNRLQRVYYEVLLKLVTSFCHGQPTTGGADLLEKSRSCLQIAILLHTQTVRRMLSADNLLHNVFASSKDVVLFRTATQILLSSVPNKAINLSCRFVRFSSFLLHVLAISSKCCHWLTTKCAWRNARNIICCRITVFALNLRQIRKIATF